MKPTATTSREESARLAGRPDARTAGIDLGDTACVVHRHGNSGWFGGRRKS